MVHRGGVSYPLRSTGHPTPASTVTGARRRHPTGARVGENTRPPRYRLLAAAAALPQRDAVRPSESFERDCPGCGRLIRFTQIHGDTGVDYLIDEHACKDRSG